MNRKQGRKLLKPPRAEFEMLYYNKAVDVEQLAAYWGVSKQTIYNWAVEYRKEGSNEPRNRAPLRSNTTDSPKPKQVQHESQPEANIQ